MICDDCGGELVHELFELEIPFGPRLVTIIQPGWSCDQCGGTWFTASDLDVADRRLDAVWRQSLPRVPEPAAKAA